MKKLLIITYLLISMHSMQGWCYGCGRWHGGWGGYGWGGYGYGLGLGWGLGLGIGYPGWWGAPYWNRQRTVVIERPSAQPVSTKDKKARKKVKNLRRDIQRLQEQINDLRVQVNTLIQLRTPVRAA